jgi:hypothetical protein
MQKPLVSYLIRHKYGILYLMALSHLSCKFTQINSEAQHR